MLEKKSKGTLIRNTEMEELDQSHRHVCTAPITYTTGITGLSEEKIETNDIRTMKLLTMHGGLHPKWTGLYHQYTV